MASFEKPKRDYEPINARRPFPRFLIVVIFLLLAGAFVMSVTQNNRWFQSSFSQGVARDLPTSTQYYERTAEIDPMSLTATAVVRDLPLNNAGGVPGDPFQLTATALVAAATGEMVDRTMTAEAPLAAQNGMFITFTPEPQVQIPLSLVINAETLSLQIGDRIEVVSGTDNALTTPVTAQIIAMDSRSITLSSPEAAQIAGLVAGEKKLYLGLTR
jgi:hypothetical protein